MTVKVHAESKIQLNTIPANASLLGGHFLYKSSASGLTQPSANIIENAITPTIPSTWGYNTNIGANGIKLRHNEMTLSEWKTDHLIFYTPGTNNPSLELISGIDPVLNFYNPTTNEKTLGLDVNGLSFYGSNSSNPDVVLDANGLLLNKGGIKSGEPGSSNFIYLSTNDYPLREEKYILVDTSQYESVNPSEEGWYELVDDEYQLTEDTTVVDNKDYYSYDFEEGITINGHVPSRENDDAAWRQIIGQNFGIDSDGKLYAAGAKIEGEITVTEGSNVYTTEQINKNYSTKDNTVVRTQRIYYRTNRSSPPNTPQDWVIDETSERYEPTEDFEVDSNKTYYEYNSNTRTYDVVEHPVVADIENYFELKESNFWSCKRISYSTEYPYIWTCEQRQMDDDSFQYTPVLLDETTTVINGRGITTHSIQADQLDIGEYISFGYDEDNKPTLDLGGSEGLHARMTNDRLSFYEGNIEVAYITGQKLYITKSVVLQQMDLGRQIDEIDPITQESGKGQWSWKIHEVDGKNNMYLKWLG